MIERRTFIAGLGATATWPLAAIAQESRIPKIGFLSAISLEASGVASFRQGLAAAGYREGRNVSVEYRSAEGNYDRLSSLAVELTSLPVSLIVTVPSSPAAVAAKKATSTTPIVFFIGADPVQLGLVATYNRPGGNATGIALLTNELTAKRVELLHELLPSPGPIALLVNQSNPAGEDAVPEIRKAAQTIGRDLIVVSASTESEIESAFAAVRGQAKGLVVWQESYFTSAAPLIVSLASRYAIPCIYGPRIFPDIGGLISYGPDRDEMYRLLGSYASKILQGTGPADLPVVQPTKFELVINLKTAKALGLTVPLALQAAADEVIE